MSFEIRPDPRLGILEFQASEGNLKLVSSLSITNKGPHKVGFKVKTTDQSVLVKPGSGEVYPGETTDISTVLTIDPRKPDEFSKIRLKLEILYIPENWDLSQLVDLMKSRSVGNGKTEHMYKMRVVNGNRTTEPTGESSSIFISAVEAHPQVQDRGLAAFQSTIDDPAYASAIGLQNHSFGSQWGSHGKPEVRTAVGVSQPIDRDNQGAYSRQLTEAIEQKDKQIGKLEQEKRKLEQELGETRSKLIANRDRPAAHAKPSSIETWKLIGFAVAALILGYFVGTK